MSEDIRVGDKFLVEEGRRAAEQGWFLEWMRENRDMLRMAPMMFGTVFGLAWIAEQTMRGWA